MPVGVDNIQRIRSRRESTCAAIECSYNQSALGMTRERTAEDFGDTLRFQMRAAQLDEGYYVEYRFHPQRQWRFDFAWEPRMLAVEIEGGSFGEAAWTRSGAKVRVGGRHNRGKGFEDDCIKYNEAALLGWCVLRVTSKMVTDGRALSLIERALSVREVGAGRKQPIHAAARQSPPRKSEGGDGSSQQFTDDRRR